MIGLTSDLSDFSFLSDFDVMLFGFTRSFSELRGDWVAIDCSVRVLEAARAIF